MAELSSAQVANLNRTSISLLLCVWLASRAQAQTSSPTPAVPVFSAETTLIHLDAVVTDRKGMQVKGLTAADFEVEADGKRFPVVVATHIPVVDDGESSPPRFGGKLRPEDVRRVITFIVARPVLESMGGSSLAAMMPGNRRIDRMFARFIDHDMRPRDLVAIIDADSLRPILNQPTSNRAMLKLSADILGKEWHNPGMPAIHISPGDGAHRVASYCVEVAKLAQEVVASVKDVPGRKLLFIVSGLLRLGSASTPAYLPVTAELRKLVAQANKAGVTIYGISPGGIGSGFSDAMGMIAEQTGGSTIENTEMLAENLGKVMELNRGYYILGYDEGKAPDKLARKVKVRVRGEGFKVTARPEAYRDGFLSAETQTPRMQSIESTLNAPLATGGLEVGLTPYVVWTGVKTGEFGAVVDIDRSRLDLGVESESLSTDLDVLVRFVDEKGGIVKSDRFDMKSKLTEGAERSVRFKTTAHLAAPGFYQVDVAVQDRRTGRLGSATALERLPDLSRNKEDLLVSNLVLRPAGEPDALPARAFEEGQTGIALSCRVAHARRVKNGREARLKVTARIRSGQERLRVLEPLVLSRDLPDLIDVSGEVEIGGLPPGDYVVEVEIQDLLGDPKQNTVTATAPFSVTIAATSPRP